MFLCKRTGVRLKLGRLTSWVLIVELHSEGAGRGEKDKGIFAADGVELRLGFLVPGVFGPPEQQRCVPKPCTGTLMCVCVCP